MQKCYIPSEHLWFFTKVCQSSYKKYLLNRRLLPVSLHSPRPIIVSPLPEKSFSHSFDKEEHYFVLNGIHSSRLNPESPTYIRAYQDANALYIKIKCEDKSGIIFNKKEEKYVIKQQLLKRLPYVSDYVTLFFDVKHNHTDFIATTFTASGNKITVIGKQKALHPVNPFGGPIESKIVSSQDWNGTAEIDKNKKWWIATLKIPFAFLKKMAQIDDIPSVIGFNALRIKRSLPPEQSVFSPINWFGENANFPLRFGDMYLQSPPCVLSNIWLGEWLHGKNHIAVAVNKLVKNNVYLAFHIKQKLSSDSGKKHYSFTFDCNIKKNTQLISIPYYNHFTNDSSTLEISSISIKGKRSPFFYASYPAKVFYKFGKKYTPKDKNVIDYATKKAISIASKLPRLIRITTADGAPSDFSLITEDGKTIIDLMKPNALRLLAEIIEKRFNSNEDRLAAASILIAQPDIMVYEIIDGFGEIANSPLSIIRFGSGICGAFATAIKGLIEEIHPVEKGKQFRAYRCGIWDGKIIRNKLVSTKSHCMVIVHCPDNKWIVLNNGRLIYAKNAHCYHLAQITDVKAIRKSLEWIAPPKKWLIIDSGSQIWPAGAPV